VARGFLRGAERRHMISDFRGAAVVVHGTKGCRRVQGISSRGGARAV
jgi:hypothetical protein